MNLLNLEDEKFKTVKVKGLKFKIRFITPLDRVDIAQRRMKLQGGNPITAMTEDDFYFFENVAINNVCIDELPDGFSEHESCLKWPDIEVINQVADEIRKHTIDIETKLKKNRPDSGGE
jgi:hypothetical protein